MYEYAIERPSSQFKALCRENLRHELFGRPQEISNHARLSADEAEL